MGIVQYIVAAVASTSDLKTPHISDLVQPGSYFCLRSYEYTKCTGHRREFLFRPVLDFVFFFRDILLTVDPPINHFHRATQIFLTLDNQKNFI